MWIPKLVVFRKSLWVCRVRVWNNFWVVTSKIWYKKWLKTNEPILAVARVFYLYLVPDSLIHEHKSEEKAMPKVGRTFAGEKQIDAFAKF